MKVDWKLFERFERQVKSNPTVMASYEKGDIQNVEEIIKSEIFDKPEDFINIEKLRKAVKADRRISLREFIEKAFGTIQKFKSKDELLDEEFDKFVLVYKPENKYAPYIRNYLKSYITDGHFRDIIENKYYPDLNVYPGFNMSEFKALNGWREIVPEYVKDYVNLNTFV